MKHQVRRVIGTALVGAALTLGIGSALGTATAHAAQCGIKDGNGVVHCDDGSYQYVDFRGHLIIKDRNGNVIRDLSPSEPWY